MSKINFILFYFVFATLLSAEAKFSSNKPFVIDFSYFLLNDTIDILDIKSKELGDNNSNNVGNMNGTSFKFGYQQNNYNINMDINSKKIEFDQNSVNSKSTSIFMQYDILSFRNRLNSKLYLGVGIKNSSAKDILITKDSRLNSFLNKFGIDSFTFENGSIVHNDGSTTKLSKYGRDTPPYIRLNNFTSKQQSLDLMYIQNILAKSKVSILLGYKQQKVTSGMVIEPKDNSFLSDAIGDFRIPNLNKNEKFYSIGVGFKSNLNSLHYELNYKFSKIKTSNNLDFVDTLNDFRIEISKNITKKLLIYSKLNIYLKGLREELNYLYTRYSQSKFDKKYGYLNFGIRYKF